MRGHEEMHQPHGPWFEALGCESIGGLHDDGRPSDQILLPPGEEVFDPKQTKSFPRWCSTGFQCGCIRSRTPFAAYLSISKKLSGASLPCSVLFPILAPYDTSIWSRMRKMISAKKRRTCSWPLIFGSQVVTLATWRRLGESRSRCTAAFLHG